MSYPKSLIIPSNECFKITGKIGQGTFASVYKAIDLRTNKLVALKTINVIIFFF